MVIHFTDKLRKKLHLPALTPANEPVGPHLRWYANLFTAQRVQYILTTNAASLYSVVIYGRGLTDDADYLRQFLGELREHLEAADMPLLYKRVIASKTGEVTLAKTKDRSVLSTMNEMVFECKYRIEYEDITDPWALSRLLNESLYSANGHHKPREAFSQLPLTQESTP